MAATCVYTECVLTPMPTNAACVDGVVIRHPTHRLPATPTKYTWLCTCLWRQRFATRELNSFLKLGHAYSF